MINVRLQVTLNGRQFWSSAIHNPLALRELTGSLSRSGIEHTVFDDFGHANVADACLVIAEKAGGPDGPIPFQWGNRKQYCCLIAPLPLAEGKLTWDGIEPRELRGPLPEEVAACTPCPCCEADCQVTITPFDVHGAPARPAPPSAAVVTVQPLLRRASLFDRIMQLILGCNQGQAVHGE